MIEIKNLSYRYVGSKQNAISNLDMDISSGKIVGLLGANGSGKSTLLYLISGLLKPASGEVSVLGQCPWNRTPEFLQNIFIVPEEIDLPAIPLSSYVEAYAPFYPNFSEATMEKALSHFNLSSDIHLASLSMGQKKKAFLAFALACHTPVLLMDEPTNGLDIPGKSEFRRVVVDTMDDDRVIVISTHQVRDLEQLLDHVLIMNKDGLLLNQSIARIQDQYYFGLSSTHPAESLLWEEPVMGGFAYMKARSEGDEESEVNLESLFNYIYFNSNKK